MRLKSLEIKGFKSFADKTLVNFDENITGIVGPNGCGKSNIVDSIRWVIGEQKISHLRSENLESLVFNGSKTRSASGLAEVSLTFENTKNLLPTEFNIVTITRKFYKSGDSEYRLNDVQCRLKDIQNLFLDTGVSTDSYAIIELGMVDDLIKDKENSRRRMLEQAAGISIYKTRKKEARQKLDATEQDLARIEDLLFEINNQLKTLENQAKKAQKYYEIKKDYREVSIELAKASLEGFTEVFKELNEKHDAETDRRVRLEAAIATEEAALESEKLAFVEKERALHSMQQGFNELVQQVRTRENEKNLAAQRLEHLKEREGSLTQFLQKAGGQITGIEESLEFTRGQLEDEESAYGDYAAELEELRASVDAQRRVLDERRSALNSLRNAYQQVQRSQFEAEKKVAVADTSIQNLQRAIGQAEEEQANREELLVQIEQERGSKEKQYNEKLLELEQLQEQQQRTKEQIQQTQSSLEGLRARLAEESRKLDAKRNEHALLKSLVDKMEGYPESVKFLHNNKGWNHTAPILSDIIYVKEEYRAAVENVLEPYLNYYVVNNLGEGMQAVRLLDGNKKGKANFFLLDKVTADSNLARQPQPEGTLPALEVIEVDELYRPLAEQLLGNVFIAEDESALEHSNGAVILERHGRYVKGHYTLGGGSVGLFEGKKIGRVKNLKKLQEQIEEQKAVVEEYQGQIQDHQSQLARLNGALKDGLIREAERQIQQLNNQVYALQNKLENFQHSQGQSRRRLEDLNEQLVQTGASVEAVRRDLQALNEQMAGLGDQVQEAETGYRNIELQYNEVNNEYNNLNLQVTRQQSKINALKQELQFKTNQLTDLKAQVTANTKQLQETSGNIKQSAENLEEIRQTLVELMRRREEEQDLLNKADQEYYNLRNQLSAKESALRQQVKEKDQVEHQLSDIKDKLNDVKLRLAGMKERLQVEFKIKLEDILDEPRTTKIPVEELQEKSDRMKKRLENLGEVNPTAIEAYEEMKKRYDFIEEQKNDLVSAKQSLLQTIAEVETTANQKFLDTFTQVRENFMKVFKALFTEDDQCDLLLTEPSNLAETGIDIVAKPKGKRPSSINQLSGGERTLTATALLFAIYLIKPAPFCILDEVDAPLDDANVGKFTNMIRQFSQNSQFIIVTHNKTTMSTVDVIYGVTMQEPGVSKLVPVDFRSLAS
ncbi:chromosome segregation protein SMC [Paraflavisolibacter sp. H34]|uniref:chromosome segregation protein SMC n=1 Tax=Huijunlia imazamoxiresistens TaxID=3127457 RepID=UPI00301AC5DB